MRARLLLTLGVLSLASSAAADVTVGVAPSSQKVRPADKPMTTPGATLLAAKNEFEAFQIVLAGGAAQTDMVTAKVSKALSGAGGPIPDANVTLYAEQYYDVAVPSNDEGAAGKWPDPLVPDVDTYFQEKRNAFPISVPAGETRVVWVDILVPQTQAPGDYTGEIEIDVAGAKVAAVPVSLHVGTFSLPSTATLQSTFGLGFNTPSLAHCPATMYPYCGDGTGEKSNAIRALYLRAGLEHRITLNGTDFQPPQNAGGDQMLYEKYVLPMVGGTGPTRLPGAKFTTVLLDGAQAEYAAWVTYAKSKTFFDRLFAYPVDEPNGDTTAWSNFTSAADALHAVDPKAAITITTTIGEAQKFSADGKIDIFSPVIDEMYGRPGSSFMGDQRGNYDAWQKAQAGRRVWMYQSCDEHGCGACKQPSPGVDYTGWPERVIDSTGVQDRAFEWWSFLENTQGELYFASDYQLVTAWDPDGQCAFSGSGDGTFFYPGTPAKIGGTQDIPVESIRLKLIREGMEDYEYLVQAAAIDPAKTRQIALALFPTPYQCNQPASKLETARAQLFAMLDHPPMGGDDVFPAGDAGGPTGGGDGGGPGGSGGDSGGGCGCDASGGAASGGATSMLLFALIGYWRKRTSGRQKR